MNTAEERKLVTRADYDKLHPFAQGYVVYMQAEWPGSELKDCGNPYPLASDDHFEWAKGQALAVQHAQDSEE